MNKIINTKFLDVTTGEVLDKVSRAELEEFIIVDFDKKK